MNLDLRPRNLVSARKVEPSPDDVARPYSSEAEAPVVIIGGSQLNNQVYEYVGADHWCNDARDGVAICQQVVQDRQANLDD